MIVFLQPQSKLCTPEDIDSLMSSEFPDPHSSLFEHVEMLVHRPYGDHVVFIYLVSCGEASP